MREKNDYKFFSCPCFLDFVILLKSKSKFNITDFVTLSEKNGVTEPYIILTDSTWYIYCKETIRFLIHYYPEDFYEECMENCIHEFNDPLSVNCLDLFDFRDLCDLCSDITVSNLLKCLTKV